MIVFDLRCAAGHVFEAWFASSGAFEEQRSDQRVACPWCGATDVEKAVMAPNIGAKGNSVSTAPSPATMAAAMRALAAAQAKVLEKSEWVGPKFAERARAMHQCEEAPAPIHGQATRAETEALAEEGVAIAALPFPVVPPGALN